jgi:hypothetical protein
VTDPLAKRLSGDEVMALKFASHRQLARWADTPTLSPYQRAKRDALKRAVTVLNDHAYTHGCELHPPTTENHANV